MIVTFQRRYKENVPLQTITKFVADVIIVVCAAFVLISNVCARTQIIGNSMNAIFENNDSVLINKMHYAFSSPKRFDVIAFKAEGLNSSRIYVKRVIALPGETIQIREGKVLVNGQVLSEDVSDADILTAGLVAEPVTLHEDEFFVLGDNRNNSEDSRFSNIGMVRENNILGKVWMITSPVSRMRIIF